MALSEAQLISQQALSNVLNGTLVEGQNITLTADQNNNTITIDAASGATGNLDDLTDVTVSSPVAGQVLSYDGTGWINDDATAGAAAIGDLTDVTVTTPSSGQVLKYNGTAWTNQEESGGGGGGLSTTEGGDLGVITSIQPGIYNSGTVYSNIESGAYNLITFTSATTIRFAASNGAYPLYEAVRDRLSRHITGYSFQIYWQSTSSTLHYTQSVSWDGSSSSDLTVTTIYAHTYPGPSGAYGVQTQNPIDTDVIYGTNTPIWNGGYSEVLLNGVTYQTGDFVLSSNYAISKTGPVSALAGDTIQQPAEILEIGQPGVYSVDISLTGEQANSISVPQNIDLTINGSINVIGSIKNNGSGFNPVNSENSGTSTSFFAGENIAPSVGTLSGCQLFGYNIAPNNTSLSNAVAIGTNCLNGSSGSSGTGSVSIGYYAGAGYVSTSTTSVGYYAHGLSSGTSITYSTAVGAYASSYGTGSYCTSLGYYANRNGTTAFSGNNNTSLGYLAYPSAVAATNEFTLGNTSVSNLRCNDTTISSLSDERDKTNIKDLEFGINFINRMRPVSFDWARRDGSMEGMSAFGFIAQELDEVEQYYGTQKYTRLVHKDNPDKWEADPMKTYPILIKAIQELSAEVETLKAIIASNSNP